MHEPEIRKLLEEFVAVDKKLERAQYDLETNGERPMMRTGKGPGGIWPPWKPKTDALTHLSTRRTDIVDELDRRQASAEQHINSRRQLFTPSSLRLLVDRHRLRRVQRHADRRPGRAGQLFQEPLPLYDPASSGKWCKISLSKLPA